MKAWVKALWSETFFAWWAIISGVSTISTFAVPNWSGSLRALFAISGLAAFGWANFRVFKNKQTEILRLQGSLTSHETRASKLQIIAGGPSRYFLTPIQNIPHADFKGMYLEFRLMIENSGRRNSIINEYQVEIVELRKTFSKLASIDFIGAIQGRQHVSMIDAGQILTKTGLVQITAETSTNKGTLFFHIPDLTLEQFAEAGLRMNSHDRKFGSLHCRLTITDSTQESASGDFILEED